MDLLPLTFKKPSEFQTIKEFNVVDIQNIDIDLMSFNSSQLIDFSFSMFMEFQCEQVNSEILKKFVQVVAVNYLDNQFHNLAHAVSVQQFAYILITKVNSTQFSNLEVITLLMCAFCHDLGHPGVSNKFLNATMNKLGLLYGFQSTLERMHISLTLLILSDPEYDFLTIPNDKKIEIYQKITEIILVTDLANAHKLAEEIRHVPLSNITVFTINLDL
eukprot:NODE_78_length_23131_cov_0.599427.p9 type:complete len:217 gc:universal NODE_78_length_23131_cov_0.599427:18537-17887(-)